MARKKLSLLLILILSLCLFSGFRKAKTILLFNKQPITKETVLNNSIEFFTGKRIYYIFMTEKPIQSECIRVQILKKDDKVQMGGIKIVYANDYRVSQDEYYYYTDYFVLYEPGYYFMQIFSKDFLDKPLAQGYFHVK